MQENKSYKRQTPSFFIFLGFWFVLILFIFYSIQLTHRPFRPFYDYSLISQKIMRISQFKGECL